MDDGAMDQVVDGEYELSPGSWTDLFSFSSGGFVCIRDLR